MFAFWILQLHFASCILQLYFAFCNNRTLILQQAHNSKLQVSSFLSHSNCVKKLHHDSKSRPLNLIEASARWQKYLSIMQIAKISDWLRRYFSINFKFMRILKLASCLSTLKDAGKNAKSQNDQHLKIVSPHKICKQ